MSYWKRLVSGEQDNVLQYWTNVNTLEEIIIVDVKDNTDYKVNYAAFTSDEEKVGVYVEKSDVVFALHEEKGLLIEGSKWATNEDEFEVVDANPRQRSEGHPYYPEDIDSDCVYVEYVESGEGDWVEEELFKDSLELLDAGL